MTRYRDLIYVDAQKSEVPQAAARADGGEGLARIGCVVWRIRSESARALLADRSTVPDAHTAVNGTARGARQAAHGPPRPRKGKNIYEAETDAIAPAAMPSRGHVNPR